jgi:hypothetical protein
MAKVRSPNYPALSLKEAVDKAYVLHKANGLHPMSREAVAKNLGYGGLNGASLPILSALTKYGLLVPHGDQLKISEDGLRIIAEQPGSAPRVEALRRAALTPVLFAELAKLYPGNTAPSNATLESYLVQQGFTRKACVDATRAYRDTLELVSSEASAYDAAKAIEEAVAQANRSEDERLDVGEESPRTDRAGKHVAPPSTGEKERLRFTLSGERGVRIIFSGPDPTQAEIDELMDYLKVSRRTFPTADNAGG